jgi:hypothetical protein
MDIGPFPRASSRHGVAVVMKLIKIAMASLLVVELGCVKNPSELDYFRSIGINENNSWGDLAYGVRDHRVIFVVFSLSTTEKEVEGHVQGTVGANNKTICHLELNGNNTLLPYKDQLIEILNNQLTSSDFRITLDELEKYVKYDNKEWRLPSLVKFVQGLRVSSNK